MVIRPMALSDIPRLVQIDAQSNRQPWSPQMFERELSLSFSIHAVADLNQNAVGFGIAWKIAGTAQLIQLAVDPAHRLMGIGTRILNDLIELSRKGGCAKMELEFRKENSVAERLYVRNGFKKVGLRKNFYSDHADAVLMVCEL